MKFSVNWLREFVELPPKVEELADILTFAGVEIEGIEHRGLDLEHVVVAQINASSQHPNADRLSVCDVDDGTNHHRQIVCGAKNYKVGDKVPVALPGAALPNGLKIKVSKLRGVESQGMLCSPSELHLSEDSDGLLILSTPNRTATSRLLMIVLAEGTGRIPRGTHDWQKFLTPDELTALFRDAGLEVIDCTGLGWTPTGGFQLSEDKSLDFFLTARRARSAS